MATLKLQDLLANPEVLDLLKNLYDDKLVTETVQSEMTPAAVRKLIIEQSEEFDRQFLLVALLKAIILLLIEEEEDDAIISLLADLNDRYSSVTPSLSLLDETNLKIVIKNLIKNEFFVTKKRVQKEENELELDSDLDDCPLEEE